MQCGNRSSGLFPNPSTSNSAGDSQTYGIVDELNAPEEEYGFGTVGIPNFSCTDTTRKRKRKNTTHSPRSHVDDASQRVEEGDVESTDDDQSTFRKPPRDPRPSDTEDHHETIGVGQAAKQRPQKQTLPNQGGYIEYTNSTPVA